MQKLGVLLHLCGIAAAEFIPTARIMAKPLAEFGARRDVLHPLINSYSLLRESAWPQPINENPHAVFRRRQLIRTLELDVSGWNSPFHRTLQFGRTASLAESARVAGTLLHRLPSNLRAPKCGLLFKETNRCRNNSRCLRWFLPY